MLSFAIDSVIERADGFGWRGNDASMKCPVAEQFQTADRSRPSHIPGIFPGLHGGEAKTRERFLKNGELHVPSFPTKQSQSHFVTASVRHDSA
jgi:hypothetical protein